MSFMSYGDAETVFAEYAGAINENQNKALTSPISINGTSYRTVETALSGLANAVSGGGGGGTGIAIFANTATGASVKAIDSEGNEYVGTETEIEGEYKIPVNDYVKYLVIAEKNGDKDATFVTVEKTEATIPSFDATLNISTDIDNVAVTILVDGYSVDEIEVPEKGNPVTFHAPMSGEYTIAGVSGEKSASKTVSVVSGDDKNIKLRFNTVPLPIASIGDVIQIANHDCMCIGENRYIFMENIGNANWNDALVNASNWTNDDIEALYDVSNKTLMSKAEANGLTQAQRESFVSAVNNYVWLATEYESSLLDAYRIISDGNIRDGSKSSINACLPAFTIYT